MSLSPLNAASPPTPSIPSTRGPSAEPDIDKKAGEFEAILLGQWLQSAQCTFGSAPGGEDGDDANTEQWSGFATQQLAKVFSDNGGVGLSRVVAQALRNTEPIHASTAVPQLPAPAVSR